VSDDLFGRHEPPRVEMPPQPLAPTLPSNNAFWPPPSDATLSSTMPYVPPSSDAVPPNNGDGAAVLPSSEAAPWLAPTEMLTTPAAEAPPSFPSESAITSTPPARAPRRSEAKVPWFLILVFSPLLLYAIVITVFSVLLYRQEQEVEEQLRKRFEIMPDEGDNPGVHKGKKVGWRWDYESKLPIQPLPDYLCTTLGQGEPLRIGDLQVKPLRVERKRVRLVVSGYEDRPERCNGDSLVLYLNLKNLSDEYAFAPLDNYFDRCYRGGALPPFTLLEVGDKDRFYAYGGPANWYSLGDSKNKREWVEGRDNRPAVLQPGADKEYFVCTNGGSVDCDASKTVAVLFGGAARPPSHGPFLWRVRVRRGLVRYKDKDHSATAVIGVRFTDKDIKQAAPEGM
jgi:hypothetical protein